MRRWLLVLGLVALAVTALAQTYVGSVTTKQVPVSIQSVTVDGATTFAVTSNVVLLACTGAETINTITGGVSGMLLTLEHTDTECTIADDDAATASNAVDLTGAATSDVGAVNKMLVLYYNGSYWMEVAESDN